MSLLKSVQEGFKPCKCKRVKLREPPPVPYVPTKDEVQDKVDKLRNLEIKTAVETPLLLQGLHQMSLLKSIPEGLTSLSTKSVLAGEKLVATYSISM